MIQTYKLLNKCYDQSLPPLLQLSTTGLRGNDKKLFYKRSKKDIGKFSFSSRVCELWNSLPDHLKNAKDVITFEIGLDKHWSDQEIMYNDYKKDVIVKCMFRSQDYQYY